MAQAGKYGYIDPGGLEGSEIGAEEPVFIVRAQDALAAPLLAAYIDLAEAAGCGNKFLIQLHDIRGEFAAWQKGRQIKIPD